MAAIIVLLGGVLGFGAAVTAYVTFDTGMLAALLIWALSGPVSALVATVALVLRRSSQGVASRENSGSLPEIA